MPDSYLKGHPHTPVQSLTGHFLGMQPATLATLAQPVTDPKKHWYRGDEYAELKSACAELIKEVEVLRAQFQRKPPKRAGDKVRG